MDSDTPRRRDLRALQLGFVERERVAIILRVNIGSDSWVWYGLGSTWPLSASPSDVVFKEAKIAVLPALPTVGNTGGSLGESETDSSP